jgi:arylsulfate sulfotransferase
VQFGTALPTPPYQTTPALPCSATLSTNVYLVGMKPTTTYGIQATVTSNATSTPLPLGSFVTGSIPSTVAPFPTFTQPVPVGASTSTQDAIVFHDAITSGTSTVQTQMYATDLSGSVVWYYDNAGFSEQPVIERPLIGGNILAQLGSSLGANQLLRIMDPLGNPVRETSVGRINEQLAAFVPIPGHTVDQIRELHHEANLLPNGHLVVFGYIEHLFPPGTQGSTTGLPVDILSDEIIDLDQNLQVDWVWNAFDYLDVSRPALLGETCTATGGGCPYVLIYGSQAGGVANDWTHSNAIVYVAEDHTLVISMRHQDWVLKLNYQDGTGDGHIVWRLGNQGDFAFGNPPVGDSFPWFSHQHGLTITSDHRLLVFDNGNTRCFNNPTCHSRGQLYQLDEVNKNVAILVDADMGNYSQALGWSQFLQNGDLSFTSGLQMGPQPTLGQLEEFNPSGTTLTYVLQDQPEWLYRAYRMPTMYSGCCGD